MDQNDQVPGRHHDVRLSRQVFAMKGKSTPHSVQYAPNDAFWSVVQEVPVNQMFSNRALCSNDTP